MDKRLSILAVDDVEANLIAVRVILQDIGIVDCAASGEDALRVLLKRDFDAILLDVMMPGMDGFELAEHIRQHQRFEKTPIIFLTALADSKEDIARAHALGAAEYIIKPFTSEMLRTKVLEVVNQR